MVTPPQQKLGGFVTLMVGISIMNHKGVSKMNLKKDTQYRITEIDGKNGKVILKVKQVCLVGNV